jgi:FkbM family methyltransferase
MRSMVSRGRSGQAGLRIVPRRGAEWHRVAAGDVSVIVSRIEYCCRQLHMEPTDNTRPSSPRSPFFAFGHRISAANMLAVAAMQGVRPQFGQSGEDAVLQRLIGKKVNGFYVDIGAFHPVKYSNTYVLYQFFGWNGINVDATADAIRLFNQARPDDINLHLAVGHERREAPLWRFDRAARNTLSPSVLERQTERSDVRLIAEDRLNVFTLASILDRHLPAGRAIDLLNVDVEGLDLEVLESNDWTRFRPAMILVEDMEIRSTSTLRSPIATLLANLGYSFVSHTYDTSIYVDGRLGEDGYLSRGEESDACLRAGFFEQDLLTNAAADTVARATQLAHAHPLVKALAKERDAAIVARDKADKACASARSERDAAVKALELQRLTMEIFALQTDVEKKRAETAAVKSRIEASERALAAARKEERLQNKAIARLQRRCDEVLLSGTWQRTERVRNLAHRLKTGR